MFLNFSILLKFAALLVAGCFAFVFASCIREEDLTAEQRAHVLERELMCPVCDGQTLDQSQAQVAKDMRRIIAEQTVAGQSSEEIKAYFVARYGEGVLAEPTGGGLNTLAWIMPAVIAGGGALVVFFAFRGMLRPRSGSGSGRIAAVGSSSDLSGYIRRVDEDLGLGEADSKERGRTVSVTEREGKGTV